MLNAANTQQKDIGRDRPYHNVSSTKFGIDASAVAGDDYKPAKCRKCKKVAKPAHVCDGAAQSLVVWCELHCPKCLRLRAQQE